MKNKSIAGKRGIKILKNLNLITTALILFILFKSYKFVNEDFLIATFLILTLKQITIVA